MRRLLVLAVLLIASVACAEMLHPSGGSQPLDGLPLRTEFGGIGVNGQTTLVDGDCLEGFVDTDGLMKIRSAGDPCGTGSGSGTPVPTQTPWGCGTGNYARGMRATPECVVAPTPDGRGTECSTSSCNLNASTTLNSQPICLLDGTNCPAGAAGTTITADDSNTTAGAAIGLLGGDGITTSVSGDDVTVTLAPSEVGDATWGIGSNFTWTFNGTGATDSTMDVNSGSLVFTGPTITLSKDGVNGVTLNGSTAVLAAAGTGSIVADDVQCGTGCISAGELASGIVYATPTPVPTPASNPALAANQCFWANGYSGIVCEGSTANTVETYITVADPTSTDKTITFPNATGSVPLLESTQTWTGDNVFSTGSTRLGVDTAGIVLSDTGITKGVLFDPSTGVLKKTGSGSIKADALSFATPTANPYPTPTAPYPVTVQEGDVTVSSAGSTIDFDSANFDITESPSGEANVALSTNVLTTGSTVQCSQLDRVACDDSPRKYGNDDDVTQEWKNALGQWRITVKATPAAVATPAVRKEYPTGSSASTKVEAWTVNGAEKLVIYGDGTVGSAGSWTGSVDAGSGAMKIPNSTSSVATTLGLLSMDTDGATATLPMIAVGDGTNAVPVRACAPQHIQTAQNTANATTYCVSSGCNGTAAAMFQVATTTTTISSLRMQLWNDQGSGATVAATLQTAAQSSCAAASDAGANACSFSDSTLTCTITGDGSAPHNEIKCSDTTHKVQVATGDLYRWKVVTSTGTTNPFPHLDYVVCLDASW